MASLGYHPVPYVTTIRHHRRDPVGYGFTHRHLMWLVDLESVGVMQSRRWLARVALSFEARDHLGDAASSIRANLERWVADQGVNIQDCRVRMLTNARSFGYCFNPITVYWVSDPQEHLRCVIAEVHNTYGGRHCYLLRPDDDGRADVDKAFHVSPFNAPGGTYRMRFTAPGDRVAVAIALDKDGQQMFGASLVGVRRPADRRTVALLLLRWPLAALRATLLIRRHGVRLWLRGLRVQPVSDDARRVA